MKLQEEMYQNTDFLSRMQAGAYESGWIELICGCMFSGKTEELIRRLNRALIAKQDVRIFKPEIDVRYDEQKVVSHNKNVIPSLPVSSAREILKHTEGAAVIGIDEAQFFDDELPEVCKELANSGMRVVIAGLDMDSEGKPFGSMPLLLTIAEFVTKLHAVCTVCGGIATHSLRLSNNHSGQIQLGEKDLYEPRCRRHFFSELEKNSSTAEPK